MSPFVAPFGHTAAVASCLLLGEERTWFGRARRSEFDPVSDIGFLIETSCGTSGPLSALRPHEAMGILGAQEVMMQVSDPLPAGNRHIQIFYAILEVR